MLLVLSVTATGGPCLRGICDEKAAEITIVISTMYSADAQWYTENKQRDLEIISIKTARREEIKP